MPTNARSKKTAALKVSVSAEQPTLAQDVQLTNPLGVQSVYANDFGIGFTLTDVRLIFNELGAEVVDGKPSKILRANVVVPLVAAEMFAHALLKTLEVHKKNLQAMQTAQPAAHA
jgi:hypothetical protein